jgi:hypothetical protein
MSLPTASGIERAIACPGSAALPTIDSPSEEADRGTAVHLYLERINGGMAPPSALDLVEDDDHRALCAAIDLDRLPKGLAPEVAFAYDVESGAGRELGRRLGRRYPDLGPNEVAGTGDAVGLSPTTVFVGDYKTGYHAPAAKDAIQLHTLGLAAARAYDRDEALIEIIRVRENGSVWRDQVTLDVIDLANMALLLVQMKARIAGQRAHVASGRLPDVVEGDHCRLCSSWSFCPAKATTLVRVATGAALDPLLSLLPLTPEMAGHAYAKLREARRVLERLHGATMAALDQYGELPLPSGAVLRKVTEPGNERLDGRVVFGAMRDLYDQELAEAAVDIEASKAGIERALKAAAAAGKIKPRGRAAAARAILKAVRERDGASNPMVTRVVEVAVDPAKEEVTVG